MAKETDTQSSPPGKYSQSNNEVIYLSSDNDLSDFEAGQSESSREPTPHDSEIHEYTAHPTPRYRPSRLFLIPQILLNWNLNSVAELLTSTFSTMGHFDLTNLRNQDWHYNSLELLAELSNYTTCRSNDTSKRDELVYRLETFWQMRMMGAGSSTIGTTMQEAEESFREDLRTILDEMRRIEREGSPGKRERSQSEDEGSKKKEEEAKAEKARKRRKTTPPNDTPPQHHTPPRRAQSLDPETVAARLAELRYQTALATTAHRTSLLRRLTTAWQSQRPVDIIPDAMRTRLAHPNDPMVWNVDALEQLVQIGEEGDVLENFVELRALLLQAYRARRRRNPRLSRELMVEDTQMVLDAVRRGKVEVEGEEEEEEEEEGDADGDENESGDGGEIGRAATSGSFSFTR